MMRLTVLGSGAFAPSLAGGEVRNPAGYAVETRGGIVLLDLGFGDVRQLARAGLDLRKVTDAFFSHRHPDHCGDLAALLFILNYGAKPAGGSLRLWGPRGFAAFFKRLSRAYAPWLEPKGYRLSVRELDPRRTVAGRGWTLACQTVPHSTDAVALRLSSGRRSLVYTGDTGRSPALVAFARGCGLLLTEATTARSFKGHLSARHAVWLAEASVCKTAVFTHLSDESERELKRYLKARPRWRLAHDLMRVVIPEDRKLG